MASEPKQKTLSDGTTVRWWCTVSLGQHPDGRRRQTTVTARTKTACYAEAARIEAEAYAGEVVRPSALGVPEMIDDFVAYATFGKAPSGAPLSYPRVLKLARDFFAKTTVKAVRRQDVERFRDWALASGRYGSRSHRTVNEMLYLLGAAFDLAERDGKVARNPCKWVRRVPVQHTSRVTWTEEQVQVFIKAAADDRLHACWLISLLGLRRSEVCGLRWENVRDGTLAICQARVQAAEGFVVKGPKSERGYRELPLFEPVTSALEDLRHTQKVERLSAGKRYEASGFVAADQLGRPVRPSLYSIYFRRLAEQADLPRIRLHDARHSVNTLLEHAGVPDSIRAAWLGHTIEVNRGVYTHASGADLAQVSDALSRVFGH